jgi:hypothetical protein
MDTLRRSALGMGVAGAIVLIALAVAGAVTPQLALIGAVAVCGAMMLLGHGSGSQR